MQSPWDQCYQDVGKIRWFPDDELIRFIARRYGINCPIFAPRNRTYIKILELGCGNGPNLHFLTESGFTAIGLDASARALLLCEQFFTDKAPVGESTGYGDHKLHQGDLLNLPHTWTNTFDGVVDVQSIQHTTYSDHPVAYEEVLRVLKPGGWFFSKHMNQDTWDYQNGGGNFIDAYTKDRVEIGIFPGYGTVCMPPLTILRPMLTRFVNVGIEEVSRTYEDLTRTASWFIVTAEKPNGIG
jgi:SAM-dependent methyltransferase